MRGSRWLSLLLLVPASSFAADSDIRGVSTPVVVTPATAHSFDVTWAGDRYLIAYTVSGALFVAAVASGDLVFARQIDVGDAPASWVQIAARADGDALVAWTEGNPAQRLRSLRLSRAGAILDPPSTIADCDDCGPVRIVGRDRSWLAAWRKHVLDDGWYGEHGDVYVRVLGADEREPFVIASRSGVGGVWGVLAGATTHGFTVGFTTEGSGYAQTIDPTGAVGPVVGAAASGNRISSGRFASDGNLLAAVIGEDGEQQHMSFFSPATGARSWTMVGSEDSLRGGATFDGRHFVAATTQAGAGGATLQLTLIDPFGVAVDGTSKGVPVTRGWPHLLASDENGGIVIVRRDPSGLVAEFVERGDGVPDDADNCLGRVNADQLDTDGNGVGDVCQDSDEDGVIDTLDNCPLAWNSGQTDTDADGIGDRCDAPSDEDFDGVPILSDNCPYVPNTDQADLDGDALGDACDDDDDQDGWNDVDDNCPGVWNFEQFDWDVDGSGDACDPDQWEEDRFAPDNSRPAVDFGTTSTHATKGCSLSGMSHAPANVLALLPLTIASWLIARRRRESVDG